MWPPCLPPFRPPCRQPCPPSCRPLCRALVEHALEGRKVWRVHKGYPARDGRCPGLLDRWPHLLPSVYELQQFPSRPNNKSFVTIDVCYATTSVRPLEPACQLNCPPHQMAGHWYPRSTRTLLALIQLPSNNSALWWGGSPIARGTHKQQHTEGCRHWTQRNVTQLCESHWEPWPPWLQWTESPTLKLVFPTNYISKNNERKVAL